MLLSEGLRDPQGECPNSNLKWSLQSQHQLASPKTSQPVAANSTLQPDGHSSVSRELLKQNLHDRLLDESIQHRRNTQPAQSAVRLRYLYPLHRLWSVCSA
jgi:hypothetical protein